MPRRQFAARWAAALALAGLSQCSEEVLEAASERIVGPDALTLTIEASPTALLPDDVLVVRMTATNPTPWPMEAAITCLRHGLALRLVDANGGNQSVFTGIPPCKVPNYPTSLRLAAGEQVVSSIGLGAFGRPYPPGPYALQVVFQTADTIALGPSVALDLLPP